MGKNTTAIDAHIGARLRLRRRLLCMNQDEIARKVGVTYQQFQKYEQGKTRVPAARLWEVSQALGVPIGYFFEGLSGEEFEPGADGHIHNFLRSRYGAEFAELMAQLEDPSLRHAVLSLMRTLVDHAAPASISAGQPGVLPFGRRKPGRRPRPPAPDA